VIRSARFIARHPREVQGPVRDKAFDLCNSVTSSALRDARLAATDDVPKEWKQYYALERKVGAFGLYDTLRFDDRAYKRVSPGGGAGGLVTCPASCAFKDMETVPLELVDSWTPIEVSMHGAICGATSAFAVPRALVADLIRELRVKGARNVGCLAIPVRGAEGRGLRMGSVVELNCVDMLVIVNVRAVPRKIGDLNASSEVRSARREMTGRVGWRMMAPISCMVAEDALVGTVPAPGSACAEAGTLVLQLARALYHASPCALGWDVVVALSVRYTTWLWVRAREGRLRRRRASLPPQDVRHELNVHQWTVRGVQWLCSHPLRSPVTAMDEFMAIMNATAAYVMLFREELTLNEDETYVTALDEARVRCGGLKFSWQ